MKENLNLKTRNLFQRFSKLLKGQDAFGHKITLNYQNQPTFRSVFGGIVTILLRLALFGYFLSNMIDVINKAQNDITFSAFRRNLSFDPHTLNLTKNEFDMGLFVSYFGDI